MGDLEEYFELMYKYERYAGGFVWEWCDHGIYMGKTEDGRDKFYYGGDFQEELHDKNFCMDGLVYPDRRIHTGLLEHKNVARPIRAVKKKIKFILQTVWTLLMLQNSMIFIMNCIQRMEWRNLVKSK